MKDRIRRLRKILGLSQAEFAQPLGINPSTVSIWERDGKIPEQKLNEICRTYGVNKTWLKTGVGNPTAPNEEDLETPPETIGDRIRAVRKKLRLTQTEFAARLKVSMQTVVNWEKDSPIAESKKEMLIYAFNINPQWLESGTGEMFTQNREPVRQYETAREFAIRNGCDEITSLIFERFMELPDSDKKVFEDFVARLLVPNIKTVPDAAEDEPKTETNENQASEEKTDPSKEATPNMYRDVFTINNSIFDQNFNV